MDTLEDRLKQARLKAGFTQAELSNLLGISLRTLTTHEKDASNVSVSLAQNIAQICKVDEIWLLTGQGSMLKKEEPDNKDRSNVTKVIIEHQGIVQQFKNPEKGLENNEYLLGIEKASEELYKKVSDYLKTTHEAATIIMTELKDSKKTPKSGEDDIQNRESS